MRAFVIGLLLCIGVVASAPASVRDQVESSLLVTGSIEVDASGEVIAHRIDQPERIYPAVLALVDRAIAGWRFQPAMRNGQPRAMDANMRLFLVARRAGDGEVAVRIASAHFREPGAPETDQVQLERRGRLAFPGVLVRRGVSGTVYVAVRLDREGHVADAAVRQVDLTVIASPADMARWRDLLARPTLAAARRWTFRVPTTGPHAGKDHYTGVLPVAYSFNRGPPAYGEWQAYVPGPRADIAWLDEDAVASEALPEGEFAQDAGLRLLTPLEETPDHAPAPKHREGGK
jgi:hypothetical protein